MTTAGRFAILTLVAFCTFLGGIAAERKSNRDFFRDWVSASTGLDNCREEVRRLVQVSP